MSESVYGVDADLDILIRHRRVLALAREMMLADDAIHVRGAPYTFGSYIAAAEAWIRYEDDYVLPEDMR